MSLHGWAGQPARIQGHQALPQIEIYTSPYCGYCHRAKALLARKGAAFLEIDVMADGKRRAEMLARSGGRQTVPQIFIGDRHVGGCDDLYALESKGELDPLLKKES
jgi:glutaredoxin 3